MKRAVMSLLVLFLAAPALAAVQGQILNCDQPDPYVPEECVDNWALDLLDESKPAIENATGPLPRDRKHYFDTDLTGAGVHIFIFDTGVDGDNPDFKMMDDPGTDRFGVRFGSFSNVDGSAASHGTRVAALAAGLKYGVAKGATIHPIYTANYLEPDDAEDILNRLNWIYDQVTTNKLKPAVVNMSFNIKEPLRNNAGKEITEELTMRLQALIAEGVVVVASAGNHDSGMPEEYWPTSVPEVIAVGGVDELGNRWVRDPSDPDWPLCVNEPYDCGSDYGPVVDLWAPAKYLRSAVKLFNLDFIGPRVRSGTSYAAPLVTGLAAMHLQANPLATPAQVLTALRNNAANLGDIDGDGTADHLVRMPDRTPACNAVHRMFTNAGVEVDFLAADLVDSCPAGFQANSLYDAGHGVISVGGVGPSGALYRYLPDAGYTGPDVHSYTIYDAASGIFGTGTVKVTVQPDHN